MRNKPMPRYTRTSRFCRGPLQTVSMLQGEALHHWRKPRSGIKGAGRGLAPHPHIFSLQSNGDVDVDKITVGVIDQPCQQGICLHHTSCARERRPISGAPFLGPFARPQARPDRRNRSTPGATRVQRRHQGTATQGDPPRVPHRRAFSQSLRLAPQACGNALGSSHRTCANTSASRGPPRTH